uniref:BTB domain-containing protein n=1 Tax=Panagrolaimus sp. PS1159 TaxID=55785 RepID=A0AC35GGR0_9BILA
MASSKRKYENLENLEISALWMCTEGDLHSNIMKDDCVKAVPNLPNVKYNFKFYPKLLKNPHVFLSLEMPKNMNIAVNATISCESASYAHKSVLQTRSTMLKSLINFKVKTEPGTKKKRGMSPPISESSSSDLFLINNYGFNIVEKAVLFCYDIPCFDGLSAEDGINLLKFAEEFQMTDLKEKAEEFCIKVLSGSNAYFCVNSSVNVKAEKLYHKCFEFLLKCMKYGTPVKNVDKLNAEMKEKLFAKAFVKA